MIGKQYLHTAQALLRIAKNIKDETIANRLIAFAADNERRVSAGRRWRPRRTALDHRRGWRSPIEDRFRRHFANSTET
jgi:hypothetical protein